ncbi:hypothetical protein EPN87_02960 [archaeon]|nr:MAG: hypothetical protein EPN87_02960 [archaeon]
MVKGAYDTRRADDTRKSEKYNGRWVIGDNLVFSEPSSSQIIDNRINPHAVTTVSEEMPVVNEHNIVKTHIEPQAMYMELLAADRLKSKLSILTDMYPEVVGEVALFDGDDTQSLLAVYAHSTSTPSLMADIKNSIDRIAYPVGKVLAYEISSGGVWKSIDFDPGIKYKERAR